MSTHHDYSWMDNWGGGLNSGWSGGGLSRSGSGLSSGWSSSNTPTDNVGSSSNALSLYSNFLTKRIRKF